MPDGIRRTPTCPDDQDLLALAHENCLLRQENDQLQRQAQGVAEANAHAAELMARLEETNDALNGEVQRRRQVEEELRQVNGAMEARIRTRTAELAEANEQLAQEVEERKQIEETLRESERRLRTVLDGILTGVLVVDAQSHQIVDVNPHAAEIIGLPQGEILGHICHCFVCPAEKGNCPISDLGQTIDRSERFLLRADGTKTPVLKTVVRSTWGGREYLIESFVDISRLKRAEEQVRDSLSLLEAALEATADGILVLDLAGEIKSFNRQFQRLWGIPDAILETRSREKVAAFALRQVKDPDAFRAKLKEFQEKPSGEDLEIVLEFQDGRILECHSKPQVIGDRVVGRVWGFRDVTERAEAERRLAYLASFPERNPNPVMEVDLDGRVRYANPAALHLFPDLREQDQTHPWLVDWATVVRSLHDGQTGTRDVTIGERSYQQLFHSFARDGFVRIYGVDITERVQAEAEIKESLSLLEATLNATADGFLVVDLTGKIKGFNGQFQRLWGLSDAVLKNRNNEETAAIGMRQVKDPEAFQAMRKRSGAHPEVETFDVVELKDGRVLERYSRPQIIGNGVVGQVLGFRDVTERHQAELRRAALLHKVAEINEELSHFAYIVSHDLKAPLRGIKLVAEWLCADYGDKLGDEGKEQMTLLQSRVNRMHNLIDGVLQYSRVGRVTEDMVEVNLNELLPVIVDMIAPPDHIRVAVDPGLPTIQGEKTRVTQVFQNLLSNAVKFLDKPQGEIHVGCVAEGEFWKFSVADNGPGIEEKHFERIFRIFQTLAPKDEYESTGVGLTLVKKIVEMYGGRVWVESEVGKGSTFLFTVPRRQREVHDV